MKKVLFLLAVSMLMLSSTGCWHWWNRGPRCNACGSYGGGAAYYGQETFAAPPDSLPPPN